jgi:hypothetical protein
MVRRKGTVVLVGLPPGEFHALGSRPTYAADPIAYSAKLPLTEYPLLRWARQRASQPVRQIFAPATRIVQPGEPDRITLLQMGYVRTDGCHYPRAFMTWELSGAPCTVERAVPYAEIAFSG